MGARDYQYNAFNDVFTAWNAGHKNVLFVLPTGGGKTYIMSMIANAGWRGGIASIAHRKELVEQISGAFAKAENENTIENKSLEYARLGIKHRIIAPQETVNKIVKDNYRETGVNCYDPNSPIAVVAIDTLKARFHKDQNIQKWAKTVVLWEMDEAHHVLAENKWGKVEEYFPNAKGLGVTATPERADGMGLGRHHDGIFDIIVLGPPMRWMIDQGYLTDYRIICPPSDLMEVIDEKRIGKDGDFTRPALKKAAESSHIIGDVVEHYQKYCDGKQSVVFATDRDTAASIATMFNQAGIKAAYVDGETPQTIRSETNRRFKNGDYRVLTNVELFGEGYDIPALDAVTMARPTQSYGLAVQQFGRALRPKYAPGYDLNTQDGRLAAIANGPKPKAIILDHVGNFAKAGGKGRHPLPDAPKQWTLDRRKKRSKNKRDPEDIPNTACVKCWESYAAYLKKCPHCGYQPVPTSRNKIEFVEGDLIELDPEILRQMREQVPDLTVSAEQIEHDAKAAGFSSIIARSKANKHRVKQDLRAIMGVWGKMRHDAGRNDSEMQREFYMKFGIDVLTAQTLAPKDADILKEKIMKAMQL